MAQKQRVVREAGPLPTAQVPAWQPQQACHPQGECDFFTHTALQAWDTAIFSYPPVASYRTRSLSSLVYHVSGSLSLGTDSFWSGPTLLRFAH